jgi:ribonuclease HII
MDFIYEQNLIARGFKNICGIDEAGRGPLAGPLVTAAVILDSRKLDCLNDLQESKSLTEKKREEFFCVIIQNAVSWSVGVVNHSEIDKHGLSFANKIAMKRAWKHLTTKPDYILTDYLAKVYFETKFETIIKGDKKILSIAAASILAKVFHDRMMNAFAKKFPDYGFEIHKGYGTKLHLQKIKEYGPCQIHRKSFKPIKATLF